MENKLNDDRFEQLCHDLGLKIGESAAKVISTSTEIADAGEDYIKENPKKSLAIAAVAGLILGSLLTMVLRKRP